MHVGENDLQEVIEAVINLTAKSRYLGLALGVSVSKLDEICAKHNDPGEQLTEILHTWLKQSCIVQKYGQPSWRTLVKAVDKRAGGANPALAKKIAADHPGTCTIIYCFLSHT